MGGTLAAVSIDVHLKPGMVLICDFRGTIAPEICKTRPVVVVSPAHVIRAGLIAVVPLSTTRPRIARAYHACLTSPPFRGASEEVWAKCDLAMSVSLERLRRIRLNSGELVIGEICKQDLRSIYRAVAFAFGIDVLVLRQ